MILRNTFGARTQNNCLFPPKNEYNWLKLKANETNLGRNSTVMINSAKLKNPEILSLPSLIVSRSTV